MNTKQQIVDETHPLVAGFSVSVDGGFVWITVKQKYVDEFTGAGWSNYAKYRQHLILIGYKNDLIKFNVN